MVAGRHFSVGGVALLVTLTLGGTLVYAKPVRAPRIAHDLRDDCAPKYRGVARGHRFQIGLKETLRRKKAREAMDAFYDTNKDLQAQGVPLVHLPFLLYQPGRPTVVLIHGIAETPHSLEELAKMYDQNGFNVVTTLLEGHGKTPEALDELAKTKPEWLKQRWRDQVEEAVHLASDLGGPVVLGGYSLGGSLALDYAKDHPEAIDGLALHSPIVHFDYRIRNQLLDRAGKQWAKDPLIQESPTGAEAPKSSFDKQNLAYDRTSVAAYNLAMDLVDGIRADLDDSVVRNRWKALGLNQHIALAYGERDRTSDLAVLERFIGRFAVPQENILVIPAGSHPASVRTLPPRNQTDVPPTLTEKGLPEFIQRLRKTLTAP